MARKWTGWILVLAVSCLIVCALGYRLWLSRDEVGGSKFREGPPDPKVDGTSEKLAHSPPPPTPILEPPIQSRGSKEWPYAIKRRFRSVLLAHLESLDPSERPGEIAKLIAGESLFPAKEEVRSEFGECREQAVEEMARIVCDPGYLEPAYADVIRAALLRQLGLSLSGAGVGGSALQALSVATSFHSGPSVKSAQELSAVLLEGRRSTALKEVLTWLPGGNLLSSRPVLDALQILAREAGDERTREIAVLRLSGRALEDETTFGYIKTNFGSFPVSLRAAALTGISQADEDRPDVRNFVRQVVLSESSDGVRCRAVDILARSKGQADAEVLGFVRASLASGSPALRLSAVEFIARKGEASDLARLRAMADHDPDPMVRKKAATVASIPGPK